MMAGRKNGYAKAQAMFGNRNHDSKLSISGTERDFSTNITADPTAQ